MESPLFLPTLRTDHELRKFSPSLQRVILSNAKDLLLRRPKQILHFIQDDILGATIAMVFMKSARAEESALFHSEKRSFNMTRDSSRNNVVLTGRSKNVGRGDGC